MDIEHLRVAENVSIRYLFIGKLATLGDKGPRHAKLLIIV